MAFSQLRPSAKFLPFQPSPTYSLQCTFEIVDTLIGLVIFAVIVGDIGNMVTNMNAVKADFETMLDRCKQYMVYR